MLIGNIDLDIGLDDDLPKNKLDQRRPLEPEDTELQTLGCRHSNPDICRNNATPKKCAFVLDDNICTMVPRTWKQIYYELKLSIHT